MNIDEINLVISKLQQSIRLVQAGYQETNDYTLQFDEITLKVVLSNMEKRRANHYQIQTRNGEQQ